MLQPSNFLMLRDNPLTRLLAASAAVQAANSAGSAPSLAALRGSTGGAAASYDPLTGAYMAATKTGDLAEPAVRLVADIGSWPAGGGEGEYTGGWLKGIDFGCSNEVPPGMLLCKMTVRLRCLCLCTHASRAMIIVDGHHHRIHDVDLMLPPVYPARRADMAMIGAAS